MIVKGHRIKRRLRFTTFKQILSYFKKEDIKCTYHTLFRLSEKQKLNFDREVLLDYILNQEPIFVGKQFNDNFAVYFKYSKKKAIKIILDINKNRNINIVTFYIVDINKIPQNVDYE